MDPRSRPSCFDKAVELLGRRPHFRAQLAHKLRAREYSEEEIEETLGRLVERGYLDDGALAASVASTRATRGGEGARRIAAELARRGASPGLAREAAAAALPGDEVEAALAAARRWTARGGGDAAALARHLDRKGFSRRAIVAALRQAGAEPEAILGGDD